MPDDVRTPAEEQGAGKRGVEGAETPGTKLGDLMEDTQTVESSLRTTKRPRHPPAVGASTSWPLWPAFPSTALVGSEERKSSQVRNRPMKGTLFGAEVA